jgi:type I restriction enzyme, S subunit
MELNRKIPKHWKSIKVSDIGDLIRGVNYKKEESTIAPTENYLPILRGNNVAGEIIYDDFVYVNKKNISPAQMIQENDIVFAMSSGSKHLVGKSARVKTNFTGSFGAFCGVFRANENVNKVYVGYFFQSPYYKRIISEISKGTNINNLKREHILDLDFPSPPLTEQQIIVSKIEELLSDLENGKHQLLLAQQQLKVYRQSLLKWAFEGKLTNKNVNGELPKGWKIVQLNEVIEKISDGPFGSNLKTKDYVSAGIRVIRLENIGEREFRNDYKSFITSEKYETLVNHTVSRGDIIFSSFVSENIRSVILPDNIEKAINKADCFLVRVSENKINKKYLELYFSTRAMRNQLVSQIHGATRPRINTTQLKASAIPMAPLKEQQYIVNELESKLTVCDKIEETISQSLKQAETLRQSILKKAFEGSLI